MFVNLIVGLLLGRAVVGSEQSCGTEDCNARSGSMLLQSKLVSAQESFKVDASRLETERTNLSTNKSGQKQPTGASLVTKVTALETMVAKLKADVGKVESSVGIGPGEPVVTGSSTASNSTEAKAPEAAAPEEEAPEEELSMLLTSAKETREPNKPAELKKHSDKARARKKKSFEEPIEFLQEQSAQEWRAATDPVVSTPPKGSLKAKVSHLEKTIADLKSRIVGLENEVIGHSSSSVSLRQTGSALVTMAAMDTPGSLKSRVSKMEEDVDDLRSRTNTLMHNVIG